MNYRILTMDIMNWFVLISSLNILISCKNKKDKLIIYLLILSSYFYLIARVSNNSKLFNVFHLIFATVMILVPILTSNYQLLKTFLITIIMTIISRKIFGGCMLRTVESKKTNISKNSFTSMLNWDIIFPILAFITGYKIIYHKEIEY